MPDDEGFPWSTAVGVALVAFLAFAFLTMVLAAMNATPGEGNGAPEAEWTADRINETHVRIEHAGGAPVDADRLLVTVDGIERSATWSGRIDEGDSGVVRARQGRVVALFWSGGRSDQALLNRWESVD